MAATTTETAEDYDFDGWTQEKEDAALRRLIDVKCIIVEKSFVARFADGTILKIPLNLSMEMIDELEQKFTTPIEQFRHLLSTFMGEGVAEDLSRQNLVPVGVLVEKYFRALTRAQQLAFPES